MQEGDAGEFGNHGGEKLRTMGESVHRSLPSLTTTFRKSFPELEDTVVEWTEAATSGERRSMSLQAGYAHGRVRCSNPGCQEGGFEIAYLLRRMIGLGQREQEGTLVCTGWEAEDRPCVNTLRYRVSLRYKNNT